MSAWVYLNWLLQNVMYMTVHLRYHSKPNRAAQRSQNLTLVFAFMTDIEHLQISDISKSNTQILSKNKEYR